MRSIRNELIDAIEAQNMNGLRAIIEANPDSISLELDQSGNTVLHLAAWIAHPPLLRMLLECMPTLDVNSSNAHGLLPVHCAIESECYDSIRLLITAGSKIDLNTDQYDSPLQLLRYHICSPKTHSIVGLLYSYGLRTSLTMAVAMGQLHCVQRELLCNPGAYLESKYVSLLETACLLFRYENRIYAEEIRNEIVLMLLKHGFDPNRFVFRSPLEIAGDYGDDQLLAILTPYANST